MDYIKKFLTFLKEHKWKWVGILASTLLFAFWLFPFSDLNDYVSTQVSKLTSDQIYLQFDNLRISLFPQAGVALNNVKVEGKGLPTLKTQDLIITPAVLPLLNLARIALAEKMGLSPTIEKDLNLEIIKAIKAQQFLNGQVEVSLNPGTKTENGTARQKISISAQKLSLAELRGLLELPLSMKGNLSLESQAQADLTFQEQPDMDFQLKIEKFELPVSNLEIKDFGPLSLPELKLAQVDLKGRLTAGKLIIEQGVIGQEKDEVHGNIKGDIMLFINGRGKTPAPEFGGYNFEVSLNIKKSFQDRAAFFLLLIEKHMKPNADGALYSFKISGPNLTQEPSTSALK